MTSRSPSGLEGKSDSAIRALTCHTNPVSS
ncbi:hypothetical protein SAMN05216593_12115 [Pseudomonas asturiensis]|uniref:Uncharacterized protein n=1 Tax=Pseudomonas asturiensis TaxID=1190415 RepID=A0A1M7Q9S2_9PSED|nr:hypothetical protein SAMN05216593_12115 [Pseudomonas asturiensis]